MEEKISKELFWNKAAVAGLALGGVSIAYTLLGGLIQNILPLGILSNLLIFGLWMAKFIGCIWLMRFFMVRYINLEPLAGRGHVFRFGALTAFLSALIYSGFLLFAFSFIEPGMLEEAIKPAMDMLNSDQQAMMGQMLGQLPTLTFFSYLIYCSLYGTILSAILSSSMISNNPFRNSGFQDEENIENTPDDQSSNQ